MIGIAFDVDYLGGDILGAIANRVDDGATADRAVRAGGARFAGTRDFQRAQLGVSGLQVKSKNGRCSATDRCVLKEVTT
jgi:hypothetical protein